MIEAGARRLPGAPVGIEGLHVVTGNATADAGDGDLTLVRHVGDGGAMRRKYSDDSIVELFELRESSETTRQATDDLNLLDDIVRSA